MSAYLRLTLPPQSSDGAHGWRRNLGIVGLILLTISIGPSASAISVALLLLAAFFVSTLGQFGQHVRNAPLLGLLTAITIYTIVQGSVFVWFDVAPESDTRALWHMVRFVGVSTLLVGWATYHTRISLQLLLTLFLIGFCLAVLNDALASESLWVRGRLRMLRSPNELGLVAATAILITAFIGTHHLKALLKNQSTMSLIAAACASFIILQGFFFTLLLLSGSRSAWIGFSCAVAVVLFGAVVTAVLHRKLPQRSTLILILILICLVGLSGIAVSTPYHDSVQQRMQPVLSAATRVLEGDIENIGKGSIGARIPIWESGLARVAERPLTGWGSGAVQLLSGHYADGSEKSHFHNLYLHLAVALGVPAAVLWLLILGGLLWRGTQGLLVHTPHIAWLVPAWGALYGVASLFQIRLHSTHGAAYYALFSGMLLASYLYFRETRQGGRREEEKKL